MAKKTSKELSPQTAFLLRTVKKLIIDFEGVSERSMFGCITFFANGNIFVLIDPSDERLYVKITDEKENAKLSKLGGEAFMPGGDAMHNWLSLPESLLRQESKVERYLQLAYGYAAALPRKIPKTRSKKM